MVFSWPRLSHWHPRWPPLELGKDAGHAVNRVDRQETLFDSNDAILLWRPHPIAVIADEINASGHFHHSIADETQNLSALRS